MDFMAAGKSGSSTPAKVRPITATIRGVRRDLREVGNTPRQRASNGARAASTHSMTGVRARRVAQPSPPRPTTATTTTTSSLVVEPKRCGGRSVTRASIGNHVCITEAECFLTRLALEDCLVCLENLQCMLLGNPRHGSGGETQTECGCSRRFLCNNPLRLSRRPLLSIAEDLSLRLNQLTDGYEPPFKQTGTSDRASPCRTKMEAHGAALAEDTFGPMEETQYSHLSMFENMTTDENAPIEQSCAGHFFGKPLSPLNTDEASTAKPTRSADACGNDNKAFVGVESNAEDHAIIRKSICKSLYPCDASPHAKHASP